MCEWGLVNRLRGSGMMDVEKFREWCEEMGGEFYVTREGIIKCVFPSLVGGDHERK